MPSFSLLQCSSGPRSQILMPVYIFWDFPKWNHTLLLNVFELWCKASNDELHHLQTDQLEIRLKAVGLVGDLFALPGSVIPEAFQPIFSEFLKRLSDRVVAVRMSALEHIRSCLLSNPLRAEASQIFCKY